MMTIIEIRLIMVCIYFVNTVKAYMMLMSMPVTELQRNLKISKKLFKWYCLKYLLKLLKWEIGLGQLMHFSWRDFWGGDRVAGGVFGVFAVGGWLSLMVIRAMLRKYMALSKNWIFILYLHSSKNLKYDESTQAELLNLYIFLLVVKCKWGQHLKITRFLLSTKILSFWHKLTLLFK